MDLLKAVECDGFIPALHRPPLLLPEIPVHWERLLQAPSPGNGGGGWGGVSLSSPSPKLVPNLFSGKMWDGGIEEIPVGWGPSPLRFGGESGGNPGKKVMGSGNPGGGLGMMSLLGLGWGGGEF